MDHTKKHYCNKSLECVVRKLDATFCIATVNNYNATKLLHRFRLKDYYCLYPCQYLMQLWMILANNVDHVLAALTSEKKISISFTTEWINFNSMICFKLAITAYQSRQLQNDSTSNEAPNVWLCQLIGTCLKLPKRKDYPHQLHPSKMVLC